MKLIEIYGEICNIPTSKSFCSDRIKQLKILAEKYGEKLYQLDIADSCYGSEYLYIGRSADDINDQNAIYDEMYLEDADGYTLFDRCEINIREI